MGLGAKERVGEIEQQRGRDNLDEEQSCDDDGVGVVAETEVGRPLETAVCDGEEEE